jgi:micrococcal nuclease
LIRDGQTLRWGACAFLLLATPAVALDRGTVISGPAHVIDGDTIDVAGFRVRLHGVAAPERSEPGGAEATAALRQIIADQVVQCSVTGEKTHQREVGTCWIGAQDIAAALIAAGRARDCPRFSAGRYAAIERPEAKALPLPRYCR